MEAHLNVPIPHPPHPTPRWRRPVVLGVVTGILAGAVALFGLAELGRAPRFGRPTVAESLRAARRNAIVQAVENTRRSVVTIRLEGRRRITRPQDELMWLPFAPGRYGSFQWVGSGFFIDAGGYILTNEHVVRDAGRIVVSLGDPSHGMSVPAELVGVAPQFDLALLHVRPPAASTGPLGGEGGEPPFVPARIGDSDDLMMGEWAIAIGSPFGSELGSIEPSVSVGVISAVQRDVPPQEAWQSPWPYLKMIQTDAAIHQGNSGGPLVNANGEVIGVNTVSFAAPAEGGTGIHFAIPINTARWVWQELLEYGEVRKPWIGWSVAEIDPEVRAKLQLPEEEGVLTVTEVVRDSPADRAGIRPGDVLRGIRGLDPYSLARAERILFGTPVGADVEVEVLRVGDGHLHRTVVHVIEDPYTRAEREARGRQPLG